MEMNNSKFNINVLVDKCLNTMTIILSPSNYYKMVASTDDFICLHFVTF